MKIVSDLKQRNVTKIKDQIFNSNPCYGKASSDTRDTHGEREREREREEWVVLYCKNANSENKSHINAKPQQ
jgi:hypothetical protein